MWEYREFWASLGYTILELEFVCVYVCVYEKIMENLTCCWSQAF